MPGSLLPEGAGIEARIEADPTPELGAEPGVEGAERTPDRTPRAPKPPRRTLYAHEVPDMTAERVLSLAYDDDGTPLEGPPLDDKHPVEVHALRLLMHVAGPGMAMLLDDPPIARGKVERGLFAFQAEHLYYVMCAEHLWWHPHRWEGTGGVAEHFRKLLKQGNGGRGGGKRRNGRHPGKPAYKYVVREDGLEHRQLFYPMPPPTLVLAPRAVKPTPPEPKRTPKAAKGTPRRAAAPVRRAA
jgi:hypothetical protein